MSPIISGGGGGNTTAQVVASGKVLPAADPSGATVNTTSYDNAISGSGKYTTLVAPVNTAVFAAAVSGDTYPRIVVEYGEGAWWMGDGSSNDPTNMAAICYGGGPFRGERVVGVDRFLRIRNMGIFTGSDPAGGANQGGEAGDMWLRADGPPWVYVCTVTGAGVAAVWAPILTAGSPLGIITSGALPTLTITSGTGRQILTTRDAETVTPFTGDGTNNAATCAIALSPDNVTYSTMATISIAAALNLTGVLTDTVNVRVPAGWYVKLTAVHGTIGTTTYY